MRLIRCYIAGFGTFVDKEITFDQTLHAIYEKNGFGKTTLANFIAAMLYGMPTARAGCKNIREQYNPWSGAKYGGTLVFSAADEVYRIERTFDTKSEKKDKLKVSCESRNNFDLALDSKTPGEYFLGISKEIFYRTVFYSEIPEKSKKSDLIDRVTATLSGSEDSDRYQKAIELLNTQRKRYKLDRGTGGYLDNIKDELFKKEETFKASVEAETQIEKLKITRQSLKTEKEDLDRKITYARQLRIYTKLEEDRKSAYEEQLKRSPALPSETQLEQLKKLAENASACISGNYQLSPEEAKELAALTPLFSNPDTETKLTDVGKKIIEINTQKEALKELKDPRTEMFYNYATTHTDKDFELLEPAYFAYSSASEKRDPLEQSSEKTPLPPLVMLISGCIGTIFGSIFLTANAILGIFLITFGLLTAAIAISLFLRKKTKFAESSTSDREYRECRKKLCSLLDRLGCPPGTPEERYHRLMSNRNEYLHILKEYQNYQDAVSKKNEKIASSKMEITDFFSLFSISEDLPHEKALETVKKLQKRYDFLAKKNEELNNTFKEQTKRHQQAMVDFLKEAGKFSFDHDVTDVNDILDEFINARNEVENSKRQWKDAQKKTAEFRINEALTQESEISDIEDACEHVKELEKQIEKIDKELNAHAIIADKRETLEKEIADLSEHLNDYNTQYGLLVKTKALLERANNTLKAEIASPLHSAYRKYADQVDSSLSKALKVDLSSLSLFYERDGEYRSIEHFSAGQRAISDICLRCALIDLIYEKEKPCIILDDPFVHLDGNNLKNALLALKTLSKDLQIIYLTCHESRMV